MGAPGPQGPQGKRGQKGQRGTEGIPGNIGPKGDLVSNTHLHIHSWDLYIRCCVCGFTQSTLSFFYFQGNPGTPGYPGLNGQDVSTLQSKNILLIIKFNAAFKWN